MFVNVLLSLVAGLATACGANGPETIKMVYWPGPESEAMKKVVNWYNSHEVSARGRKIEMVLFGRQGFWEKEESIMAAGSQEVDLFFTASYVVGKHAPYLEPLNSSSDSVDIGVHRDLYLPTAVEALEVNGDLYAVPLDVSAQFLFYRADLFDALRRDPQQSEEFTAIAQSQVGRALEPKRPEAWDWGDFLATALFYTKAYNAAAPTDYGTALQTRNLIYNVMIWDDVLYSLGGSWFRDDRPAFDTPEARRAMDLYIDVVTRGATPPASSTYEYPEANEAFKSGKVAMILQWSAAYHELTDPEKSPVAEHVGMAPIPGPKHATHVHALGVGLNKTSLRKRDALRWLAFLATPDAMTMYAAAGGVPPMPEVLLDLGEERPELPFVADQIRKYGFVESTGPETMAILEILSKRLSAAWALNLPAAKALVQAQEEVSELMK